MSEQEFELYLSLLGRMLRLDSAQREQIADELRDHFEERLDELIRLGHSRPEAIARTLEEFGDAAGLAAHFTHISHRRKKRLIMRCTLGTIVGMAAAILVVAALWPTDAPVPVNGVAVAQQAQAPQSVPAEAPASLSAVDARRAAIEEKLNTRLNKIDFIEVNFSEVLKYLSDFLKVDILVNKRLSGDDGFSLDHAVTLDIKHSDVAARTVLELSLEHFGDDIGYTIRDGLIYITHKFDAGEIRVYNCRDLLGNASGGAAMGMAGDMAMMPDMSGGMQTGGMLGMSGGFGSMKMGLGGGGDGSGSPGSGLEWVIVNTIHPESWTTGGGGGSIEQFNGLLIVKQSQAVHREIKELLDQIRVAAKAPPAP